MEVPAEDVKKSLGENDENNDDATDELSYSSESDIDDEEFERQKQLLLEQRRLENEMWEKNRNLMRLLKEQEDKLSKRLAAEQAVKEASASSASESGSVTSESELDDDQVNKSMLQKPGADRIGETYLLYCLRLFLLANLFVIVYMLAFFLSKQSEKRRESFWSPLRRFVFSDSPNSKPGILPPLRVLATVLGGLVLTIFVMLTTQDQFLFGPRDPAAHEMLNSTARELAYPVHLAFQNIGCKPTGTKAPISNISGVIRPGRITAIIGPSGAGKSTLSQFFLGRGEIRCTAHSKGSVFLNGRMRSLNVILDRVGSVPQNDALIEDLTVEEMLLFSATWRLPKIISASDRLKVLNETIYMLDLQNVRKSRIGGLGKRGISGGEKKRVSIAVELIAKPSVLIMDEPTSGLDSAGAFSLMKSLRRIAESGVSVVVALHVPSERIYDLFDDVILLQQGEEIYVGPRDEVENSIKDMGFILPSALSSTHQHITMPEFLVDVLAGAVNYPDQFCPYDLYLRDLYNYGKAPSANCGNRTTLATWWRAHGGKDLMSFVEKELIRLRENEDSYGEGKYSSGHCVDNSGGCLTEADLKQSSRDLVEKCNVFLPRPTLRTFCLIVNGIIRQPPYPRLPKPGLLVQAKNWFDVIWKERVRSGSLQAEMLGISVLGGASGWVRSYATSWDERVVGAIALSIAISSYGAFTAVFTDAIEPVKRACEGGAVLMSHHGGQLLFTLFSGLMVAALHTLNYYVVLWVRKPKRSSIPTFKRFLEFVYLVWIYHQNGYAMGWLACVAGNHNFTKASLIIMMLIIIWHIFARFSVSIRISSFNCC